MTVKQLVEEEEEEEEDVALGLLKCHPIRMHTNIG